MKKNQAYREWLMELPPGVTLKACGPLSRFFELPAQKQQFIYLRFSHPVRQRIRKQSVSWAR